MENNLSNATLLLMIGMSTVFVILFIIVSGGNLLIRLINRIDNSIQDVYDSNIKNEGLSPTHEAAIYAVVNLLTEGKARVEKIERK